MYAFGTTSMSNYKDNTYNGESVSNGCTKLQTIIIIEKWRT